MLWIAFPSKLFKSKRSSFISCCYLTAWSHTTFDWICWDSSWYFTAGPCLSSCLFSLAGCTATTFRGRIQSCGTQHLYLAKYVAKSHWCISCVLKTMLFNFFYGKFCFPGRFHTSVHTFIFSCRLETLQYELVFVVKYDTCSIFYSLILKVFTKLVKEEKETTYSTSYSAFLLMFAVLHEKRTKACFPHVYPSGTCLH